VEITPEAKRAIWAGQGVEVTRRLFLGLFLPTFGITQYALGITQYALVALRERRLDLYPASWRQEGEYGQQKPSGTCAAQSPKMNTSSLFGSVLSIPNRATKQQRHPVKYPSVLLGDDDSGIGRHVSLALPNAGSPRNVRKRGFLSWSQVGPDTVITKTAVPAIWASSSSLVMSLTQTPRQADAFTGECGACAHNLSLSLHGGIL
jgi:hypothetical protein